mmetsp:Transcript_9345/g.15231  ORF Transcript_9345/g.15231 Transcript_9345/m.15231 type:complete len:505 (-) Transcript_9345:3787-5301(-)
MHCVKLKWNKQVFPDVKVDPAQGAMAFKETLYKLTGVPVERQKIMAKGIWKGTLKDDTELVGLPWTDGALIAMMGTSTGIPKPPEEETVFLEDMTAQQKQKVAAADPPGLTNLGNTCYMNSTLQCLKVVPEFRASLDASSVPQTQAPADAMTIALRDLFKEMDGSTDYVTPYSYVQQMRATFPRFAEQSPKGGFAQQDADEFFNELVATLAPRLTKPGPGFSFEDRQNAIDALFQIRLSTEMKCLESDGEPVIRGTDSQRRLQCNITADVVTLEQGISLGFEAEIEKNSSILNRNALWKQTRRIEQLPKYLAIQFNRFFWKRTPQSRDHQGVNCKILKPVKFSMTLDVFNFCDEKLQKVLKGPRDAHAKELMARGKKMVEGDDAKKEDATSEKDVDVDMEEQDEELKAALQLSMQEKDQAMSDATAGIGIPKNFRGVYELFAVLTHKGRASDSGHYMGWVKQQDGDWICFDDETASRCKEEDIGQLSGGGDYDMAYMVFYRAKE